VADLAALVSQEQRAHRLPSLTVAVASQGKPYWEMAVGYADTAARVATTVDTQYRIGSITKTFTAAVVLLLVEDGLLDLDARLGEFVPGSPLGKATIRQALSHIGGVPREAMTAMWETHVGPDRSELVESIDRTQPVDRPGTRWHYSNLGYAILGEVVQQVAGVGCDELIADRLWAPLDMSRTSWQASAPTAHGYRVDPYQDVVHREPQMDQKAVGVAGQAWSTVGDLLSWARALLGDVPSVLPYSVIDEMHTLQVMVDAEGWTKGWGLGLILNRYGDRVLAGHTGAMPGFLAAMSLDRSSDVAVVALTNATRGARLGDLAAAIHQQVSVDVSRPEPRPWQTDAGCPAHLVGVLGRWWSESEETVFVWRDGSLHAYLASSPADSESVFAEVRSDLFRVVRGREHGEQLEIVRDAAGGGVDSLRWATYRYRRNPG
jgi:CubicO group peptidase (beta-lactamase class C family)